jgi:hypothetical protein
MHMRDPVETPGSNEKEAGAGCAGFLRGDTSGPPQDAPQNAARLAFLETKQLFLRAVDGLDHPKAAWLRREVQAAEDMTLLWLLRRPLLATLRGDERARSRGLRAELYRYLDTS